MVADRDRWRRVRERAGAIRVRTTAAAVLVVGVSLVVAATAMVAFLDRSLLADVRRSALARADAVATALAAETAADALAAGDPEEEFVQVVSADGSVVAASANVSGRPPLVRLAPGGTATIETCPSRTVRSSRSPRARARPPAPSRWWSAGASRTPARPRGP
jgi:hypothetical protein